LLDVDNTLVQWKGELPSSETLTWLEEAKRIGFQLCLISNTRRPARLMRLSEKLEIPVVRGRMKPSRAMYRLALIKFNRRPEEAIMIGDQLITDVFGANRSGIDAVWVERMEGPEFKGTAVNRMLEGFLKTQLYKALVKPAGAGDETPTKTQLPTQLIRFIIVGGTSFTIDYIVKLLFMRWTGFGATIGASIKSGVLGGMVASQAPLDVAAPVVAAIAWAIATINSLIFNRKWTFEAVGRAPRAEQIRKFFTVTLFGAAFNITLFTAFYNLLPGKSVTVATVLASVIVAVWNFLGQRNYAFKPKAQ
jgi:HAD superfamily phosphatase (TIGR01668 family)